MMSFWGDKLLIEEAVTDPGATPPFLGNIIISIIIISSSSSSGSSSSSSSSSSFIITIFFIDYREIIVWNPDLINGSW